MKKHSTLFLLLLAGIFCKAQDRDHYSSKAEFYIKTIEAFLTEKYNPFFEKLEFEQKQHNNILVVLCDYVETPPASLSGFNILYKKEDEVCDYLRKEKQSRTILKIATLDIMGEDQKLIYVVAILFFKQIRRKECTEQIYLGGNLGKKAKYGSIFIFDCDENKWKMSDN